MKDNSPSDHGGRGQEAGHRGAAGSMKAGTPANSPSGPTTSLGETQQLLVMPRSHLLTRGWRRTFVSLESRDFRYLMLGMLALMSAVQMQMMAGGFLTYDITKSPLILGVVNVGFALPMLATALFGGAIADRVDRKRVMQMGQGASALIALFIAISITTETVTWHHLLAVSMLQGVVFSFVIPARTAIIPQLVGKKLVTNAMAMNAAGMSVTSLIAPALAGTLYALIGPDGVFYVIGAIAVSAVLFTHMISRVGAGTVKAKARMVSDIKAGLSYVLKSPLVLILLAVGLLTALLATPFRFLMPVFVVEVYGRGPEAMGLLLSMMGLGSLVGALFIASMGKGRRGILLISSSLLAGLVLLLVALIPVYFAAVAFMVIFGLTESGRYIFNQALIMEQVEDEYRGRVMSVFMMNYGLMPLGVLPVALIAEFFGARWAIGLLAGLLLVFSWIILVTQRRLREVQ